MNLSFSKIKNLIQKVWLKKLFFIIYNYDTWSEELDGKTSKKFDDVSKKIRW